MTTTSSIARDAPFTHRDEFVRLISTENPSEFARDVEQGYRDGFVPMQGQVAIAAIRYRPAGLARQGELRENDPDAEAVLYSLVMVHGARQVQATTQAQADSILPPLAIS